MKHKYVKNFAHLINIINQVIAKELPKDISDEQLANYEFGDDKFYYDHVYTQPYCDQFTWEITNGNPHLMTVSWLTNQYHQYLANGYFCGKNYNKIQIKISDELKDK
jgi:hypothetical protein